MSFAIGLRFYKIEVRQKNSKEPLHVGPEGQPCDLFDFFEKFVEAKSSPTEEKSEPRSWFFERKPTNSIRTIHGYINYGTHGFESKLKDVKTKKEKYSRLSTDLEEIPLYFQIWIPSDSKCAFMCFQSFQGRSCVNFVRSAVGTSFKSKYSDFIMSFSVIVPATALLDEAPVKAITFSRRIKPNDKADAHLFGKQIEEVDFELSIKARRRGAFLSRYNDIKSLLKTDDDGHFIQFDGNEYERVKADVKFGNRRRMIGLFGSGLDAGLVEASEKVKRSKSGHPIFESIANEVDEWFEDINASIKT
jgi:hypothetical protein